MEEFVSREIVDILKSGANPFSGEAIVAVSMLHVNALPCSEAVWPFLSQATQAWAEETVRIVMESHRDTDGMVDQIAASSLQVCWWMKRYHGNPPDRCVLCAIDIAHTVTERLKRLPSATAKPSVTVALDSGDTTGLNLGGEGRKAFSAVGLPVVIADKTAASFAQGGVYISQRIADKLGSTFLLKPAGSILQQPVFQVVTGEKVSA